MKRFILFALVCALGWLGFISGKNDGCGNTYYNSSDDNQCHRCLCHQPGITIGGCETGSGQCNCNPGHTGRRCNKCEKGWYVVKERTPCKICDCDEKGSVSSTCNPDGGQCPCNPSYTGRSCNGVEAQVVNIGRLKEGEHRVWEIGCKGHCDARSLQVIMQSGGVVMTASDGRFVEAAPGVVGSEGEILCNVYRFSPGTEVCQINTQVTKNKIFIHMVGIWSSNGGQFKYKIGNAEAIETINKLPSQ